MEMFGRFKYWLSSMLITMNKVRTILKVNKSLGVGGGIAIRY